MNDVARIAVGFLGRWETNPPGSPADNQMAAQAAVDLARRVLIESGHNLCENCLSIVTGLPPIVTCENCGKAYQVVPNTEEPEG